MILCVTTNNIFKNLLLEGQSLIISEISKCNLATIVFRGSDVGGGPLWTVFIDTIVFPLCLLAWF